MIEYEKFQLSLTRLLDYDGEKARRCLALVPEFMSDAISLYQTLSGSRWR